MKTQVRPSQLWPERSAASPVCLCPSTVMLHAKGWGPAAVALAVVALGFAGCGSGSPQRSSASGGHPSIPVGPPKYAHLGTPACGDIRDESLEHACWRVSPAKGATFIQVSASCGVSERHEVECWKDGLTAVPAGRFELVDDDALNACAARSEGGVACWGLSAWPAVPSAPKFVSLSVGGSTFGESDENVTACGLTVDKDIQCWGNGKPGWSGRLFLPGPFAAAELGSGQVVGLTLDGFLYSFWGRRRSELERKGGDHSEAIHGHFKAFCHRGFSCQVQMNGKVECQGSPPHGSAEPPGDLGPVVQIRSGYDDHACALEEDGDVKCWGDARPPPDLKFRAISRPDIWDSYCGITRDGQAYCWGDPSRNPEAKLEERLRQLESVPENSR